MTVSPPKVNGRTRPPAMPVLGDWQSLDSTPAEPVVPQPESAVEVPDAVAQAEAEAIRARAWAESEERRLAAEAEKEAALKRAEAEAEAIRAKAVEENRRIQLANDRAERKAREEEAASEARIAESNRRRAEANQAREEEARKAKERQQAEALSAAEVAEADDRWRTYALNFYRVCAVVALPVQLNAFYDRDALWLMAAPLMLEGGAWVVQKGAASAVANGRPSWHYRLISWLLAFIAAGINLWHGLAAFDPATALGTAFASIAGPGVWDLHEHGRIRKRDGAPTRRERKAAEKEAKRIAAEKVAEEKRRAAEKEAAEKAAAEKAKELADRRAKHFPKVLEHAEKLAADLGETTVSQAIWEQAKLDVEGAKPGESADVIRMRNAAEARVEAARQNRPVNTVSKTMNAQRAVQVKAPRRSSSYTPVPPRRKKNDTPKFHPAARTLAADAKRAANARQKDPS